MRRVVLTGSECTGKTTLARDLAAHYGTLWVPEYAREYTAIRARPLEASDVEAIARGQLAAEDCAAKRARHLLILDTDLVSTLVYSRHYYGACPAWIADAARKRLASLYLLHHADVPWLAEGLQRDRPAQRDEVQSLFRDTLASLGAPIVDIQGPWQARRELAVRAIDALTP
jgi:NadR type nicotinamide-nucleotide adenylyltransferase